MGPENEGTGMTYYIDSQPVSLEQIPEIEATSPAPVNVADLAASLEPVLAGFITAIKQAAAGLVKLWDAVVVQARAAAEFHAAMRWAEAYNRPLANRYHHTKKKRTRKKYAKRILAWYRTEVVGP